MSHNQTKLKLFLRNQQIMQQRRVNLKTYSIQVLYFELVKFYSFFLKKHVLRVVEAQLHQLQFQQLLSLFDKFYQHNKDMKLHLFEMKQ